MLSFAVLPFEGKKNAPANSVNFKEKGHKWVEILEISMH